MLLVLTGCAATADATTDIISSVVDWREFSFLNLTNSDIAGFTWVFRFIGAAFLLFWYFRDGDEGGKWLFALGSLGLITFAPDIMKVFGQLLFPGVLNPSWIQETTRFDSVSALSLTLLFPVVHQAVEGVVILMIFVNSQSAAIGKNPQSFIWGISWAIGWLLTPTLYAIAVRICGGLVNFDGLLGGIIETAVPQNTIYNWIAVGSWIVGYLVIPITVLSQRKQAEKRSKATAEKSEKKKKDTDWDAILAVFGGYAGSRMGSKQNSPDTTDGPTSRPNIGGGNGPGGPRPSSPRGGEPIQGMDRNPDHKAPRLVAKTPSTLAEEAAQKRRHDAEETVRKGEEAIKPKKVFDPDEPIIIDTTPKDGPSVRPSTTQYGGDRASAVPRTMSQDDFDARFPKNGTKKDKPPGSTAQTVENLSHAAAAVAVASGHPEAAVVAKVVGTVASTVKNGQRTRSNGQDSESPSPPVPRTMSQEEFEARFPQTGKKNRRRS
jgi:hypothetical protein